MSSTSSEARCLRLSIYPQGCLAPPSLPCSASCCCGANWARKLYGITIRKSYGIAAVKAVLIAGIAALPFFPWYVARDSYKQWKDSDKSLTSSRAETEAVQAKLDALKKPIISACLDHEAVSMTGKNLIVTCSVHIKNLGAETALEGFDFAVFKDNKKKGSRMATPGNPILAISEIQLRSICLSKTTWMSSQRTIHS
jgi:hypothetical protein